MSIAAAATDMPPPRMFAAYGFLAFPLAFAGLPLYIYLPDFYTREMGLGIAAAGSILLTLRLLDAFQDPLIGYFSDKGAAIQAGMMATGFIALLVGMGALMYGPPDLVPVSYWFAGAVALTGLGLGMTNINLVMMGGLWSENEAVCRKASGVRESISLLGMLLASILPGILLLSMSSAQSFQIIYIIFAVLLLLAAPALFSFYKNLPPSSPVFTRRQARGSIRLPARFFLQNKAFLSACFLTHLAAAFPAILFLYFSTDYLGAGAYAGMFLFIYFLSGAGMMPLWLKMAGKYSAGRAWFASMILATTTFIWAFNLGSGDIFQFAIICALSGAALGADLALPPVMMARRLREQDGESYAAQSYAILNLLPKIALAVATGCAFLTLDRVNFLPSGENTPSTLATLAMLYALVPCIIKALSAFLVFNLNNGETHDIQKRSSADGHIDGA